MINVLRGSCCIWAAFIAFLAFGGYVLLIPVGIVLLCSIKIIIKERKHKEEPLAKRRLVKHSE